MPAGTGASRAMELDGIQRLYFFDDVHRAESTLQEEGVENDEK